MDRGKQTFDIVRKLRDAMSLSRQELRNVVQETLDWLRASPDYCIYMEATVPDAFSLLPNEIIHDVVDSYGVERSSAYSELRKLVKIKGSWGVFARQFSSCTTLHTECGNMLFFSKAYDCAEGSLSVEEIPFEEAANGIICESTIGKNFDLDRLTVLAPNLYDDIGVEGLPDTHCKALNLMGTRFATIAWRGGDPEKTATPELVNFLRRQLRSNYLRYFEVFSVKFEDGAFDKELVVFVTRPWFEGMNMEVGLRCEPLTELIKGAHKAWKARNFFQRTDRRICAPFSTETLGKLEEYFKMKFDFENEDCSYKLKIRHPEESTANFCLAVDDKNSRQIAIWDL